MFGRGLRTASGRMYGLQAIKQLLTNRFYIGQLEWKGESYKGIHAPIISKKLFHQTEEILRRRSVATGETMVLKGLSFGPVPSGNNLG